MQAVSTGPFFHVILEAIYTLDEVWGRDYNKS